VEAKFGPFERKDKKRLTSFENEFFRRTAEYALFGHKRNEDILEEFESRTS